MQENFEILKSEKDAPLLARFQGEDACLVEKMLVHIEAKENNQALRLAQERQLLVTLTEDCKGMPVKDVVDDVEAYTDAVLRQPFNNAREKRHIGAQTMGLAFCALVLLVRSGIDFLNGYRAGSGPMACVTTLDLGHPLACIAILVGVRILVAGDRKIDFEDVSKMRKRKAFAGVAGGLAVLALLLPGFERVVVLQMASVAIMGFAVLLLAVCVFSRRV